MSRPTVLYATDFTEPSQQALPYAVSQAKGMDAELLIVHVREISTATGEGMLYAGIPTEDPEELQAKLEEVVPQGFDGPYTHRLLEGNPAREIVKLAKDESIDLIVVGTHGRSGLARVLMGSATESILRHAPCPVLAVKQPHPTA